MEYVSKYAWLGSSTCVTHASPTCKACWLSGQSVRLQSLFSHYLMESTDVWGNLGRQKAFFNTLGQSPCALHAWLVYAKLVAPTLTT